MNDLTMTPKTQSALLENNKISLRDYMEAMMYEYRNAHNREHTLMAESEGRARKALEQRLESMNEFRSQILTERGHMITKDKFDALHEVLEQRVNANEQALSNLRGRMTAIGASIGIGVIILQVALHFLIK